jgi:hypothetical protein
MECASTMYACMHIRTFLGGEKVINVGDKFVCQLHYQREEGKRPVPFPMKTGGKDSCRIYTHSSEPWPNKQKPNHVGIGCRPVARQTPTMYA